MAAATWRNRIVDSGVESPDQLMANPMNWRTHPAAQRLALRGSLDTVGWVQQILVNRVTGHVVDGHARVEEALSRGETEVPVLYVELDADEEALVLASLDPIGAMAGRDDEKLRELLADLTIEDAGLAAMLDQLSPPEPKVGLTDPDDAPDLGAGSNIQGGDVFVLGEHRLMCGDATNAADVATLLDGQAVDIVWTDPPYGIAYVGKTADALTIENDYAAQTRDLVASALRAVPLKAGGAFYVASPSGDMEYVFRQALEDIGFQLRQQIVWVKDVFVMGRQDYHWRHETILYGWAEGAGHLWNGGRKQDTVWEVDRPKRSESHPTMKPVELVTRSLKNSSATGDLVYDPFVGSGTTIIAAEQTRRRGYGMDIDPRYVAVALERWENFTGEKAVKV